MPYTEKQHKLFEAAAHDPAIAAKRDIPQAQAAKLASEGVKDSAPKIRVRFRKPESRQDAEHWITLHPNGKEANGTRALINGAGQIIGGAGGKFLLAKRSGHGDLEGYWAFPGGHIEPGETAEAAAIRECREEMGFEPSGPLELVHQTDKHGADFSTHMAIHSDQAEPTLNDEHTEARWVTLDEAAKMQLHPGVADVLGIGSARQDADVTTELDVAMAIRDGKMQSPQRFMNIALFDLRISGTGVSYRLKHKEFVFRNPDLYLNDEFLARCNGLPVIVEHPKQNTLNSKEFQDRIVGTILLPYIKGNEVWGIAKIYDDAAAQMMDEEKLSTSPSVVFADPQQNETKQLEDGEHLLIEGKPQLLDHLAIVPRGVWDKGGEPSGVKSSNHGVMPETSKADSADPTCSIKGVTTMAEKKDELGAEPVAKKDGEGEVSLSSVMAALQALTAKIDRLENAEAGEAKPDGEAAAASMPSPEMGAAGETAPVAADNAKPTPEIAAVEKRVDALEGKLAEPSKEESAKMADAQAKADSVYQAFGDHAPRPMMGESLLAYRARLASKMQVHSKTFKEAKLTAIGDESVLAGIETSIYADAMEAASASPEIPVGMLREVSRKDATGRVITEFQGAPGAWTGQFKAQTRRLVGIRTNFH